MLICEWDDLTGKDYWFIGKLIELQTINPLFKCTLFAIPSKCSNEFLLSLPDWIEVAAHGCAHESNYECSNWTKEKMVEVLTALEYYAYYQHVWKSPGWQSSRGVREGCREKNWVLADNPHYKHDRLPGDKIYDFTEYGKDAWHGHLNDWVGGNGLLQTWDMLIERIKNEDGFRFISEVVK